MTIGQAYYTDEEVIGSSSNYHRSSCHIIENIDRRNYKVLQSWRIAVELGLSPCMVCNPFHTNAKNSAARIALATAAGALWDLIHPEITKVARTRFESHHHADAVEAAFKELNSVVKTKVTTATGRELDGASLMTTAFSAQNPIIELDDRSTVSGRDIQQGYMQIFAGAMTGVRNPKAHGNINIDENRAIHLLFLASLLMYKLDESR
jgi:uncharacterized protein (TIGR02391 family)